MTVLTYKPEIGRTDAALLPEELAKIYSTPTPMGGVSRKVKVLV